MRYVRTQIAEHRGLAAERIGLTVTLVMQKYGGSSVADADGIKRVAHRIVATRRSVDSVVVVVSAMGDTTDELADLADQVSPMPPGEDGQAAVGEKDVPVAIEAVHRPFDLGSNGEQAVVYGGTGR
jgi:aspartokinase